MGVTYVDATVRNPAHRTQEWTGAFLVDTGAIDSWFRDAAWRPSGSGPRVGERMRRPMAARWRWTSRWASWRSWACSPGA